MWASTSSPPMCATGVVRAAMMSATPIAKQTSRTGGTGRPSRASVRARTA
jgi:hypothetical protein